MHTPLPSVVALARFSFTETELELAQAELRTVDDWQEWLDQVELHGLSGFINKHLQSHDLSIPPAVKLSLRALKIRHAAAADARYEVLADINAAFEQQAIPYLALKGAALMPHLYGEGYLRPMRDMDLLIPKSHEQRAVTAIRELGFEVPDRQPSRYMKNMHELPNATKHVNGFKCSVELHRDAVSREISGHLFFPEEPLLADCTQRINWRQLALPAFDNVTMLHQVCRHLEGLHAGGVLKLINVMDVIGLALLVLQQGKWRVLESKHPHVLVSLSYLHLLTPLPSELVEVLQGEGTNKPAVKPLTGVGRIMVSLSSALTGKRSIIERFQLLFSPSDWWLRLHYNVRMQRSLFWVKWFRHPLKVSSWLVKRFYSGLMGG